MEEQRLAALQEARSAVCMRRYGHAPVKTLLSLLSIHFPPSIAHCEHVFLPEMKSFTFIFPSTQTFTSSFRLPQSFHASRLSPPKFLSFSLHLSDLSFLYLHSNSLDRRTFSAALFFPPLTFQIHTFRPRISPFLQQQDCPLLFILPLFSPSVNQP